MREVIGPLSALVRLYLGMPSSLLAPDFRRHPQTVVSIKASDLDLVKALNGRVEVGRAVISPSSLIDINLDKTIV